MGGHLRLNRRERFRLCCDREGRGGPSCAYFVRAIAASLSSGLEPQPVHGLARARHHLPISGPNALPTHPPRAAYANFET